MSGETATPASETTPAPQPNGADTAAPAAESAAPASEAEEFFAEDKPDSEAKPEGKAEDEKAEAKPQGEAEDFLDKADTDNDDAKEKADGQADAKPEGEPEAYQPFTLPEGIELDEATLAEATPLLKKHKLDQDSAQELVSFYATRMQAAVQDAVKGYYQQLAENHAETLKSWTKDLKAVPEYKGEALAEAKGRVKQVLSTLGSPELRQLLGDGEKGYGLVRNPHVFRFLDAIASKLSEDSLVREDAGAPEKHAPMRDADVFYS